jgi:hypothetical protein
MVEKRTSPMTERRARAERAADDAERDRFDEERPQDRQLGEAQRAQGCPISRCLFATEACMVIIAPDHRARWRRRRRCRCRAR